MTLTGCASQGPLQLPSLHLPARVQSLSAERFGDFVELHWTSPTKTTDSLPLETKRRYAGPYVAEICRGAVSLPPGPCTPIARMPVESGKPAIFRDHLTPPWSEGASRVLHYRVSVVNAKGHGIDGAEVSLAAGASVPPLAGLRATPAAGGGVALRWQPIPGNTDTVRLHVTRSSAPKPETLAVESTGGDPGGASDAGAKPGQPQQYTAFRTHIVTLNGVPYTVNSAPTTATVAADALPPSPSAPIGLEAVVNTLGAPEISLVWQASDEPGVAGYLIFRSEPGILARPLTPQPINAFTYTDTAVRPGIAYRYKVVAVNAAGAQGPPSVEIERAVSVP